MPASPAAVNNTRTRSIRMPPARQPRRACPSSPRHGGRSARRRDGTAPRPTSRPASPTRAPPTASSGTARQAPSTSASTGAPSATATTSRREQRSAAAFGVTIPCHRRRSRRREASRRTRSTRPPRADRRLDVTLGIEIDRGLLGREVDCCRDAFERVERPFDARPRTQRNSSR